MKIRTKPIKAFTQQARSEIKHEARLRRVVSPRLQKNPLSEIKRPRKRFSIDRHRVDNHFQISLIDKSTCTRSTQAISICYEINLNSTDFSIQRAQMKFQYMQISGLTKLQQKNSDSRVSSIKIFSQDSPLSSRVVHSAFPSAKKT